MFVQAVRRVGATIQGRVAPALVAAAKPQGHRCMSAAAASAGQKKKVVIVTGGAAGIGLGIARSFAAESGHTVVIADTNAKAGRAVADAHDAIEFYELDVANPDHCKVLVDTVVATHGQLDVLVNNAGIQPWASCVPLHELSEHHWHQILAVNLSPIFHIGRHALPVMIEQHKHKAAAGEKHNGGGVVLNVASVQGLQSQKGVPAYAASKGAALSLTRQMAMEYGEYGIRVLAINPGTVRTPLVDELLDEGGGSYEAAGKPYPLQSRCGEIEEIGDVAVFLASDKASFMHGVDITVDGGITAAGLWAT